MWRKIFGDEKSKITYDIVIEVIFYPSQKMYVKLILINSDTY